MNSVHQETKPTYALIVRSPCSHTRNHHHPRQHDHGTPRSILTWVTVSQFQRVTFVRAKGTLEGQVMADSPMAWVRSTTLSVEEREAHWTCNPDKFAELALMLFTSLIHLLPGQITTSVKIEGFWNTQFKLLVFLFPSKKGGVCVKTVVNFLSEMLQSSCFWLSPLKGLSRVRWFDCSDY